MKDLPLRELTDRMVRSLSYAYDWDPSKPVAEQWPWKLWRDQAQRQPDLATPAELEHPEICTALAALPEPLPPSDWQPRVLTSCDEFDEADTASREPWTADAETKSTAQIGKR
jgi:hypothetical protein